MSLRWEDRAVSDSPFSMPQRIAVGVIVSLLVLAIWWIGGDEPRIAATTPDLLVTCEPSAYVHEDASITVTRADCTEFGIDTQFVSWSPGFVRP